MTSPCPATPMKSPRGTKAGKQDAQARSPRLTTRRLDVGLPGTASKREFAAVFDGTMHGSAKIATEHVALVNACASFSEAAHMIVGYVQHAVAPEREYRVGAYFRRSMTTDEAVKHALAGYTRLVRAEIPEVLASKRNELHRSIIVLPMLLHALLPPLKVLVDCSPNGRPVDGGLDPDWLLPIVKAMLTLRAAAVRFGLKKAVAVFEGYTEPIDAYLQARGAELKIESARSWAKKTAFMTLEVAARCFSGFQNLLNARVEGDDDLSEAAVRSMRSLLPANVAAKAAAALERVKQLPSAVAGLAGSDEDEDEDEEDESAPWNHMSSQERLEFMQQLMDERDAWEGARDVARDAAAREAAAAAPATPARGGGNSSAKGSAKKKKGSNLLSRGSEAEEKMRPMPVSETEHIAVPSTPATLAALRRGAANAASAQTPRRETPRKASKPRSLGLKLKLGSDL